MAKSALAVKDGNNQPSIFEDDIFSGMATGLENVTSRDLLIPRLTILQGLSPQVTRGKPEYDENAKVGDIYDTGLHERFPDGFLFLPILYKKEWLEWAPRESGKGLQGIHSSELIMEKTQQDEKTGRYVLPNGNYIVDTAQLYGFNVTAGWRRSFIPMVSTQIKKVKLLLTRVNGEKVTRSDGSMVPVPLFYRTQSFTTVPESNNKGSWMGWKIEPGPALEEYENWKDIAFDIKQFHASLVAGDVKGDVASMGDEFSGTTIDADVPF